MSDRYMGMLGAVQEAADIHMNEGLALADAYAEQTKRAKRRLLAHRRRANLLARAAESETNVIPFRR
jgi:hypothetical protein